MNNEDQEKRKRCPKVAWTEEEIAVLRDNYGHYTVEELRNKFNLQHTVKAIKIKANYLGLTKELHRKWTKNEDKQLFKLIEQYPYNLCRAYKEHASNTGRKWTTVKSHFCEIRKCQDTKTCMMTVGKRAFTLNRKNVWVDANKKVTNIPVRKASKWRRILDILLNN